MKIFFISIFIAFVFILNGFIIKSGLNFYNKVNNLSTRVEAFVDLVGKQAQIIGNTRQKVKKIEETIDDLKEKVRVLKIPKVLPKKVPKLPKFNIYGEEI